MNEPLDPVSDGRRGDGRFKPGNKAARGNPHAATVNRLRTELLRAVTPDVIRKAVAALIHKAQSGDVLAFRELMDRTIGKATATIETAGELGIPLHPIRVIFETALTQDHV